MNAEDDVFGVFFFEDFSVGSDGKERLQCGRAWRRKWQPTPVFLPGICLTFRCTLKLTKHLIVSCASVKKPGITNITPPPRKAQQGVSFLISHITQTLILSKISLLIPFFMSFTCNFLFFFSWLQNRITKLSQPACKPIMDK